MLTLEGLPCNERYIPISCACNSELHKNLFIVACSYVTFYLWNIRLCIPNNRKHVCKIMFKVSELVMAVTVFEASNYPNDSLCFELVYLDDFHCHAGSLQVT